MEDARSWRGTGLCESPTEEMATQNLEMILGFVYSFTQALSLVNPLRSLIQHVILGRSCLKAF